jgi:hypothetical membrane protein
MKTRYLLVTGIIAPIVYLFTVICGAALRTDYSHVSNAISELILAEAPNHNFLNLFFLIYNLLCLSGAVGLISINRLKSDWKITAAAYSLGLVAIAGIAMTLFFPQDPRGTAATFNGTMHLVTAGIESLGLMLAMLWIGLSLRANPTRRGFGNLTLLLLGIVFISGGSSALLIQSHWMGLLERVTIGTSLFWQAIFYWNELKFLPQVKANSLVK